MTETVDIRDAAMALADVITGFRYQWRDEYDLQEGIAQVLAAAGHEVRCEVSVSHQDRIDLLVGRIGIEVKCQGGTESVTRQLQRYAHNQHVDALILATTRAAHRDVPDELAGIPLVVAYLTHIA